jgi:hypothetical protein
MGVVLNHPHPGAHGGPPPVAAPDTPDDREYLRMMYEEHAEEARQHETLRATATSLLVALIAGILAFAATDAAADPLKVWVSGSAICLLSLLGALLNQKHYERNRLHTDIMRGLRASLEQGLSLGIAAIPSAYRNWHDSQWRLARSVRLNKLWNITYAMTAAIGVFMILKGLQWL